METLVNLCRGGIRTLVVTGDYHHTAIAVARGVGMLPPGGKLIIVQAKSELQSTVWGYSQQGLRQLGAELHTHI